MKALLSILILTTACVAGAAATMELHGVDSSGGGKGVVCRNPQSQQGELVSVQLLDLWEAGKLYDRSLVSLGKNLQEKVAVALKNISLAVGGESGGTYFDNQGNLISERQYMLNAMNDVAAYFTQQPVKVKFKSGIVLTPTDDSYELARPISCGIEQIVVYRDFGSSQEVIVNKDLFDKMDEDNQAALIVHEAFYKILREFYREKDSIRARRSVGYVFAGSTFKDLDIQLPKQRWHCEGLQAGFGGYSELYFYEKDHEFNAIKVASLGYGAIGYEPFKIPHLTLDSLLDPHQCDRVHYGTTYEIAGSGPADYDKSHALIVICENHVPNLYYNVDNDNIYIDPAKNQLLTCKWEGQ